MKKNWIIYLLCISSMHLSAQNGAITLEDIFKNGKFIPKGIADFRSMQDGLHYSINTGTTIEKYAYETGILETKLYDINMSDGQIKFMNGYAFNDDESLLLIKAEMVSRYRHATFDENYIYDVNTKTTSKLSETGKQMYANFSPVGKKVAYVIDNNLYYKDLSTGIENQITNDGELNSIINGGSDWVYEEEFVLIRSFEWSPDGNKIAYYKFDESEVPQFYMTTFKGELYPKEYIFKYPKVGEPNSKIQLYIYDISSKKNIIVDTGDPEYIPRIKWISSNTLCVTTLNRLQNQLQLLVADASTGKTTVLLKEESITYLEIHNNLFFLKDKSGFIWSSESNGYNHLYYYDMQGKLINQITHGNWDVTDFKGIDEANGNVYYLSTEESPFERHLYCIKLNGKKKEKLSSRKGVNQVDFTTGYKYYLNRNSQYTTPEYISLHDNQGKELRVLEMNTALNNYLNSIKLATHSYFNFTTTEGVLLNGYMMKPYDFDPQKKYPVFMYVYGGPGSQKVLDAFAPRDFAWFNFLTQQGYIVACVDNRGTGGRGKEFRNCTYQQLGKYETLDQIEAAKWLGKQTFVDAKRIGIFGWSYGGYMTALCITNGADVFKAAISVAPVTNWKYYDNVYTERYMGTLESNPDGFDANAPVSFADKLKGNYLLIHGSGDDNVHVQNSYEWINALIKSNKQFELMIYPDRNHGISGGNTRLHLYELMTNFILENL